MLFCPSSARSTIGVSLLPLGLVELVEAPEKVVVARELEPGDDIAPLGEECLRNRRAKNLALIDRPQFQRGLRVPKKIALSRVG